MVKKCGFDIKYDNNIGKKFIEIYHSHEWDHGYDSVSYCVDSNGRIRNTFEGTRRQFYADMREITGFLRDYIKCNHITKLIAAPLFSNLWISCNSYEEVKDICSEMVSFLKKNQIRKNSKSGVSFEISENTEILDMLLESAFRGISNLHLLSDEHHAIIEPSHHFNLIFYQKNFERENEMVAELIKGYPNLRYYEGTIK